MILINFLSKVRITSTDNTYIRNFVEGEKDLFSKHVRINSSILQALVIDYAVRLLHKVTNQHIRKWLWYFTRHTFHFSPKFNIIFSHWYFPNVILGNPKIIFSSGYHPDSYEGLQGKERSKELNQLSSWFKRANVVTFPARTWISEFTRHKPEFCDKIHYAPHLFHHLKGLGNESLFAKFDKPRKIKILFVGRDGLRKGLDTLVQALFFLKKNESNLYNKLSITVVSETYIEEMEELGIRYFPQLSHDKVIEEMKRSHIFCLPTKKESFGHVFIEAMACCCAVICDDKNPRTEFFNHGSSALLIEPEKEELLAEAIKKYVMENQLMKEHVVINFRKYQEDYSYEAGIKYYKKIFEIVNK